MCSSMCAERLGNCLIAFVQKEAKAGKAKPLSEDFEMGTRSAHSAK